MVRKILILLLVCVAAVATYFALTGNDFTALIREKRWNTIRAG